MNRVLIACARCTGGHHRCLKMRSQDEGKGLAEADPLPKEEGRAKTQGRESHLKMPLEERKAHCDAGLQLCDMVMTSIPKIPPQKTWRFHQRAEGWQVQGWCVFILNSRWLTNQSCILFRGSCDTSTEQMACLARTRRLGRDSSYFYDGCLLLVSMLHSMICI